MDISKYTDFFHDGAIVDIKHHKNKIEIFMLSCELDPADLNSKIALAKDNSIHGILHLDDVQIIKINEKVFKGILKKSDDRGLIFDFEIHNKTVEISAEWVNPFSKTDQYDFSTIKIEADKIWWENLPNDLTL